jgi:hypothetical protein
MLAKLILVASNEESENAWGELKRRWELLTRNEVER